MNAGRAAYDEQCAEDGYDIVELSVSGNSCEECAKWEGQIFSLTGATEGIPTKQDLIDAGVFHPNCTHRYTVVTDYELKKRGYSVRQPEVDVDDDVADARIDNSPPASTKKDSRDYDEAMREKAFEENSSVKAVSGRMGPKESTKILQEDLNADIDKYPALRLRDDISVGIGKNGLADFDDGNIRADLTTFVNDFQKQLKNVSIAGDRIGMRIRGIVKSNEINSPTASMSLGVLSLNERKIKNELDRPINNENPRTVREIFEKKDKLKALLHHEFAHHTYQLATCHHNDREIADRLGRLHAIFEAHKNNRTMRFDAAYQNFSEWIAENVTLMNMGKPEMMEQEDGLLELLKDWELK